MELKDDMIRLNNIHDLLVDSRKGYMEAAERVEDDQVQDLLGAISLERVKLIEDMDAMRHRADPQAPERDHGTLKGDLHRAWMDLRDALSKSENANVLSECERGEGYLLMRFDEMLADDLMPETFALFQAQRAKVQANVDRIVQLRESFEKIEH